MAQTRQRKKQTDSKLNEGAPSYPSASNNKKSTAPSSTTKKQQASTHRQTEFPFKFLFGLFSIVGLIVGLSYRKYGKFMFVERRKYDLKYTAAEWETLTKDKTVLLLGGPHRAGTTVLWQCLKAHPEISGFGSSFETGADFSEGIMIQNVYPRFGIGRENLPNQPKFTGLGQYALHKNAHMDETDLRVSVANKIKLLNRFGQYWNLTRPVWVEKSPPTAIMSTFLQALYNQGFPVKTKFLFITRHPIANAFAHKKQDRKLSLDTLMDNYVQLHSYLMEDWPKLQHDPVFLTVEDFIQAPADHLQRIFGWLGVDGSTETVQSILETVSIRKDINDSYRKMWCQEKRKDVSVAQLQQWQKAVRDLSLKYDMLNWCGDAASEEFE